MILIVGAESSGKRELARSLGYADDDIADSKWDDKPVLCHLESMIFQAVYADEYDKDLWLERLRGKAVIICNEVGSGVVPMEKKQRAAREETGRICTRLAAEAETVVRMVCGIPMVLKGSLPRTAPDMRNRSD